MSFTPEQTKALAAPLGASSVKARKQGGRQVSYIEGWHAIAEANRIFGFDGWTRETVELRCVSERDRKIGDAQKPGFGVSYTAKVRVIVFAGDTLVTREGVGAGHGIDVDCGQAHESAIKEAETDAMKRALMTFGNPFGLALYDKAQANVADDSGPSGRQLFIAECERKIDGYNDPAALATWWNSEEQKKQRRDFELDTIEVEALKTRVIKRREKLGAKVAA